MLAILLKEVVVIGVVRLAIVTKNEAPRSCMRPDHVFMNPNRLMSVALYVVTFKLEGIEKIKVVAHAR